MRIRLVIALMFVSLCMHPWGSVAYGGERPPYYFKSEDLTKFKGPGYTNQTLQLPDGNVVLIITRNYGSGVELRDAYLYALNSDNTWSQFSYIVTGSSKLTGEVSNTALIIKNEDGKTQLSVPLDTFYPRQPK